tara:strand:- start:631 stop:1254 length:624 start_codon:yes stop_codon:yes gene_type:complete
MKFLQLFLILFSANIFSYPALYIGEVESRHWNDYGNIFKNYPLTVYAGGSSDGSERSVLIKISSNYGDDFQKYFKFYKCSEKQIKKNQCYENGYTINREYENLIYILNKSIEWSRIAKKNNVEKVSKNIQFEGKEMSSPLGGGTVRFFAQGDYQSDLILPAYFPSVRAKDRYYSLDAQESFLQHLSRVDETIDRSIENNKKVDDLFN